MIEQRTLPRLKRACAPADLVALDDDARGFGESLAGGGDGATAIGERKRAEADAYAETLRDVVTRLARAGLTTRAIAKALNDRGLKPPRGGAWQAPQIMRLFDRLELRPHKRGADRTIKRLSRTAAQR